MAVKLISITLNTSNLDGQIRFYKALGFEIETVKVSKGSECYRARPAIGDRQSIGFEINIFGLKDKKNSATPIIQLAFSVVDFDKVFRQLTAIEGVEVLMDPTDLPDGRKAIVKDPDGNSIEISKSH